jgi:type IV pilus assembly protein PilV
MADRDVGMRRTVFKSGNRGGFTLIEVLIAIFLLVVALVGLASVTVMVIRGNSFSKTMTTATTLAKDKMEKLNNTNFDAIATGGPDTPEPNYSRSWTVTDTTVSGQVVMKTITVTVTWPWQGQNRTVSLDTIIAK